MQEEEFVQLCGFVADEDPNFCLFLDAFANDELDSAEESEDDSELMDSGVRHAKAVAPVETKAARQRRVSLVTKARRESITQLKRMLTSVKETFERDAVAQAGKKEEERERQKARLKARLAKRAEKVLAAPNKAAGSPSGKGV